MITERIQNAEWALLWSQSQCAMHIETVEEMLSRNRQAYAANKCMDYVPIVFGSRELCDQIAGRVGHILRERQCGCAAPR